ncbi:hypothetical protein [uncultured Butyricimonas sp.]|uniref:DUF7689 domain-containing protein n=1 Tax=uncultured Butyricimonas sp. TaxID=1268785 RepID=UPI0026DC6E3F|nr:hypothetical protein [uncultured Butyricimonas sp.]
MGEDIKQYIIDTFPSLASDPYFKITSPKDICYNCIAWAYGLYKDRWMQFDTTPKLDGVWFWWPEGIVVDSSVNAYVEAFKTNGFELCDNGDKEDDFIKIALYEKNEDGLLKCSHAARQKRDGSWMSKLGPSHDIVHGDPYLIEGDAYGKVSCFMKKRFS